MKLSLSPAWVCAALSLYTTTIFAAIPLSSIDRSDTSRYVPNTYIVEMASVSGLGGKRAYRTVHEEVYHAMRKRGIQFDVKQEFNTPNILVGASVILGSSDDMTKIVDTPGVQAIRPVTLIPRARPVDPYAASDPKDPKLPPPLSTHIMTGVDKVHAQGTFGEGIKIGIIDTGIDYTHPALGGARGSGHKVVGGYDLVGDNFNGTNTPVPDDDPLDKCAGHGTHVAGIIGADPNNPFGIIGVAPGATLSAYRVFGCKGSTSDEVIVQSLIRSYNDGMDIITLSLGGADGWTEATGSVVASRIAEQGRVVTVAAGNDGSVGSWYTSSPGNGISAIAVGSVDNNVIPVQNVTVKGVDHLPIPYLQALPFNVTGDLPIYATSTDTTKKNDACDPLPADTPNLSGHVVIVHRGTCTFTQKLDNIAARGGKVFLIYNSDDGEFAGIGVGNYTAALISADDGKFLVQQFAAKANITLSFPQTGGAFNLPDPKGGLMSSFSSYGPTYDMFFKPAFAAPGGNILSTVPTTQGSYAVMSGTSMATPFAAGAAALVLQAKGRSKDLGRRMRDLLQSTAVIVPSSKTEGSLPQTVSQQGAGLIQVNQAIHSTTIVSPAQLTLNDTVHFNDFHVISIKNAGSESVTYAVTHVPAGTASTIQANSPFANPAPVPLVDAASSVILTPSQLTIPPGMTRQVFAKFSPPQNVNASTLPVYSGFLKIASASETLKVAYVGVAANLKQKAVLDNTDTYFGPGAQLPLILNSLGNRQEVFTNYTTRQNDTPAVVYRLAFGSPSVRIDLIDKDVNFQPTLKSNEQKRSWFSWWWSSDNGSFAKVPIIGPLTELDYVPRNSPDPDPKNNGYNVYVFRGLFANKTKIENGSYRFLLRALKVTGDPKQEEDYESWISPPFGLNAP